MNAAAKFNTCGIEDLALPAEAVATVLTQGHHPQQRPLHIMGPAHVRFNPFSGLHLIADLLEHDPPRFHTLDQFDPQFAPLGKGAHATPDFFARRIQVKSDLSRNLSHGGVFAAKKM
jgi:hypothetical protein